MKYRLAVFDMDGTILNTLGDISASVNFALRAEHMPERTMAEIRGFVGNGVRRLIELSVPSDASQEACERVYNAFAEHYRLHCADATAPYSGIVDLLSRLRAKGMHTAVVSNKPDDAVKALCARYFNGLFDGICGRLITADVNGTHLCTLGHTDHLLYLICHAFKHFIHSSVGIRQVCDIILYANKFGAFIDWDSVWKKCRQIRADVFAEAVFCIGRKFLTFDPIKSGYIEHWENRDVNYEGLLEDILCAGIYGGSELSRKHSSNMTLNAFSSANKGEKAGSGIFSSIFLPLSEMRRQYKCTYLEKFPFLLPVAWAGRICKYGKEVIASRCGGKHNGTSDAVRIGRKRIALMREYGIVK